LRDIVKFGQYNTQVKPWTVQQTTYEIPVIKKPIRLPPKTTINALFIAMHYISQFTNTRIAKRKKKAHK